MKNISIPIYDINVVVNDDGTHRMTWEFDEGKRLQGIKDDIAKHILHAEEDPRFEEKKIELIERFVKRELETEAARLANPKVLTREVRYYSLDSSNLTELTGSLYDSACRLTIKADSLGFDGYLYVHYDDMINFLENLNNRNFHNPWYDDLVRIMRFDSAGIHVTPSLTELVSNSGIKESFTIHIRSTELKTLFEDILDMKAISDKPRIEMNLLPYVQRSNELATPDVQVAYGDGALAIINDEDNVNHGIGECVERVLLIANNASHGQDDPVEVTFYAEDARNLYWNIMKVKEQRRIMNGGIIYHEHSHEYGIHT